ncbi:MAG: DUF1272 domain-containing protein [Curvibacter sp.]|jgi:hypothetical protein|nr:DUF1272 domain-containing protein [Curvibacter sp.]
MLQLRPGCECCDKDLPPESVDARICSFECTFCVDCANSTLNGKCPNCGGELVARPRRPASKLDKNPPSTQRVFNPKGCSSAPEGTSPAESGLSESDQASYEGSELQSRNTANGERFDQNQLTAARPTLPFGKRLRVTNKQNGRSVLRRVTDHHRFVLGQGINLSSSGFRSIATFNAGMVGVHIQIID